MERGGGAGSGGVGGGQEVASGALITAAQLTICFLFFFFTQCTSVRRLLEKVSKSARQQWEFGTVCNIDVAP